MPGKQLVLPSSELQSQHASGQPCLAHCLQWAPIHLSWLVSVKAITALPDFHPYTKGEGGRILLLSFKTYVEMAGLESS